MLFLDGAYAFRGKRAVFHRACRPTGDELNRLLDSLSRRIVRVLQRRGLLMADPDHACLHLVPDSSLDHLHAASVSYRIAIGPRAGRKAFTLHSVPPVEEAPNNPLLARLAGFSLHAATVCETWQRSCLERLRRYITRPPIATKRLSIDGQGRVVYRYKQPFRDGSTHVLLEPLDFIARLVALVPRPRLKRVFQIDIEPCPECGGKLRVIACIEDPPLIAKILHHVRRHEALCDSTPRAPPDSLPLLKLT